MTPQPTVRVSPSDLESLLSALEVRFVALTECVVSSGYKLDLPGVDAPGLHYNLFGHGTMYIEGEPPIRLTPHTLVVVPPNSAFHIEGAAGATIPFETVDARLQDQCGPMRRFVAGGGETQTILICGFFHATDGSSMDLFGALRSPIVEQFDESDRLDQTLKSAMAELVAQEVGSAVMSGVLLKQVIVTLVRRSLSSMSRWVERSTTNLSIEEVVRSVGYESRSSFVRAFRQAYGREPSDYRATARRVA